MKKKKSISKIIGIVVGSIVVLAAVFVLSCYLIMLHYINKRNYVPTNENFTILGQFMSIVAIPANHTNS